MSWVILIFVSAIIPISLALAASVFAPFFDMNTKDWLSLVAMTLPLWFALVVLSVQQLAERKKDLRRQKNNYIANHNADTSRYNGAFIHLMNSCHLKTRTLRQVASQLDDVLNEGQAEELLYAWRNKLKTDSYASNIPELRSRLRDALSVPGFLMSDDGKIKSRIAILSNSHIPIVDNISLWRDEEVQVAQLANELINDSQKKHILLTGAHMTLGTDSSLALEKYNIEISELSDTIKASGDYEEIHDGVYGAIIAAFYLIETLAVEIVVQQESLNILSDIYVAKIEGLQNKYPELAKPLKLAHYENPSDVRDYLSLEAALRGVGLDPY